MLLAAGWETSISRRMAWPSLVSTMPPMGSSSILSMALGPRHDRMMSATLGRSAAVRWRALTHVLAAVMLDSWALRPNCLSPPGAWASGQVSWASLARIKARARTHDHDGSLHGDVGAESVDVVVNKDFGAHSRRLDVTGPVTWNDFFGHSTGS